MKTIALRFLGQSIVDTCKASVGILEGAPDYYVHLRALCEQRGKAALPERIPGPREAVEKER